VDQVAFEKGDEDVAAAVEDGADLEEEEAEGAEGQGRGGCGKEQRGPLER